MLIDEHVKINQNILIELKKKRRSEIDRTKGYK